MKLPESTLIAPEKLSHDLLVPRLADGNAKFLAIAGYTRDGWQVLERDFREQILPMDAEEVEQVKYGTGYKIRGNLQARMAEYWPSLLFG